MPVRLPETGQFSVVSVPLIALSKMCARNEYRTKKTDIGTGGSHVSFSATSRVLAESGSGRGESNESLTRLSQPRRRERAVRQMFCRDHQSACCHCAGPRAVCVHMMECLSNGGSGFVVPDGTLVRSRRETASGLLLWLTSQISTGCQIGKPCLKAGGGPNRLRGKKRADRLTRRRRRARSNSSVAESCSRVRATCARRTSRFRT